MDAVRQAPADRAVVGTRAQTARRRRPSGEPPPLPRDLATGRYWVAVVVCSAAVWLAVLALGAYPAASGWVTRIDIAILQAIAQLRSEPVTVAARALNALGSQWTIGVAAWVVIVVAVAFKRWRQLCVLVVALLAVSLVTEFSSLLVMRPRPSGVAILGPWSGFSFPARPVAALCVVTLGACYTLLPQGRPRTAGKWIAGAVVGSFAAAGLYLAVLHPSDVLAAVLLGVTVPLVAFRMMAPNAVFPVTYRRGRSAHLDIDDRRSEAIAAALSEQLGLRLRSVAPFNLEGSFGSTPLRIELDDEAGTVLFGKLYAASHMRADRWYKLWRTLRYGRLEDERPFSTVRRLVQYEDYLLRVMYDVGLPVARPYGFVTITPEREYLLVTEFLVGTVESGKAVLTEAVIDDGLRVVRQMWHAGVAHRDIKPANVLVRGDKVFLIDVAFGQVRPSPWREAVDLANMMIVLALGSSPEVVYRRALQFFTPEEIAEALASTSEATRPSLHRMLRDDGRDLLASFRRLAPPWPRVKVQRWSARRLGLTAVVGVFALLGVLFVAQNATSPGSHDDPIRAFTDTGQEGPAHARKLAEDMLTPACDGARLGGVQLMAQALPAAALVPCVDAPPVGWSLSGMDVRSTGRVRLWFDSDRAGSGAVTVVARRRCDLDGAVEVASDEEGTRRFERLGRAEDGFTTTRIYTFAGGCVEYHLDAGGSGWRALANEVTTGLGFVSRRQLAAVYAESTGGLAFP